MFLCGLISQPRRGAVYLARDFNPWKIYLDNTSLMYGLGEGNRPDKGNLRETFIANTVSAVCKLNTVDKGDFKVDNKYTFEIGGKNKGFGQVKDVDNAYLALDDIETGFKQKIPLWLFGFLY